MALDKHTLKANALSAMRAAVACDWSMVYMNLGQNQQDSPLAKTMYKDAYGLLQIEVEAQLKTCYQNLKEYYENGT